MEWLIDIVLPESDTVVLIQTVVVVSALAVLLGIVWKRPEARLLTIGGGLVLLGLMGLRALH